MAEKQKIIDEEFVVDFAKKKRLEQIIDYQTNPKDSSSREFNGVVADKYSVIDKKSDNFKSTAKYALGQLVLDIESNFVKSQDDPLYRASIEFSKVFTADSVYSKVFALVGYFVANEVTGKNLHKKKGK